MNCIYYVSFSDQFSDAASLISLCNFAAHHNASIGVTGYLYYEKNRFMQYIEGPNAELKILFQAITKDPRHTILAHIDSELESRRFSNWSMHYLLPGELAAVEINIETMLFGFVEHRIKLSQVSESAAQDWDQVIWRNVEKLKARSIATPL